MLYLNMSADTNMIPLQGGPHISSEPAHAEAISEWGVTSCLKCRRVLTPASRLPVHPSGLSIVKDTSSLCNRCCKHSVGVGEMPTRPRAQLSWCTSFLLLQTTRCTENKPETADWRNNRTFVEIISDYIMLLLSSVSTLSRCHVWRRLFSFTARAPCTEPRVLYQ